MSKPCPTRIPRSGKAGEEVNCFSVSLYEGDTPKLLVSTIGTNGFEGAYWNGNSFSNEATIPFEQGDDLDIRIEHFNGLVTHTYNGVFDYAINEWTQIYRLRKLYHISKHKVPQFFFNKKSLEIPPRMKLLQSILDQQADTPKEAFSSMAAMTYLYSTKWYLHPNSTQIRKKMDLYLESFVASGELKAIPGKLEYVVTGKAIATMEQYQIEKKRAEDAHSMQRNIVILTFVLAFFAAIQSGVIKSPELINLGDIWCWLKSRM